MNIKLKKYVEKICPLYAVIPLLCAFLFETFVYEGSKFLITNRYHYDFTLAFDRWVPVIPIFTTIYFGCYIFWVINFIIMARMGRKHFYQYIFALYASYVICAIFYIALPTTNVRPEITGNSLGDMMLRFLYTTDTPENLFPSIHCMLSWFCYIGIRGKKEIPVSYRVFSCVFALLVVVSTQVTKQHYVVDVFGGVILAELSCYISKRKSWYLRMDKFFTYFNKKLGIE
jgi:membrane-associated phospholipid phosphatase